MTFAIKKQILQQQMQKQMFSINVTSHFTKLDLKGLYFLFYAQYDIILQSFQMKQAAYLQKKLIAKSKFQQTQQIKRKFEVISQKNHTKIIKFNSTVDRLLNRLQFLWNQKNIPFFHRFYFQKNIDNDMRNYVQSLQQLILNQQKLIKNDIHIIYSLEKSIKARQSCLFQFKRFLSSLKQSDIQDYLYACTQRLYYIRSRKQKMQYQIQGYKINKVLDKKVSKNIFEPTKFQMFGECFHHLMKLTLHAIQLISKWKDYLYSLTPDPLKKKQQIDYYYQQQNYLLRIINDMNFMQTSFLAKYLKFAPKNDPFLLLPLLQIEKQQQYIQDNMLQSNDNDVHIQQSTQLKCLKRIFAPQSPGEMVQILSKLRILVQQFQNNIKNRKIFDLKIIYKINDLDYTKMSPIRFTKSKQKNTVISTINSQQNSPTINSKMIRSASFQKIQHLNTQKIVPSGSLKKLPPLKDEKQSFSINLSTNNSNPNPLMKLTNQSLRSLPNSLRKNLSTKQQKNQALDKIYRDKEPIGLKLMNHKQLEIIKEQLKQKLKKDFCLDSNKTSNRIFQKPQLAQYIQTEVKKMFLQTKFNSLYIKNNKTGFQETLNHSKQLKQLKGQLFVQTYSIQESQLISHINFLYQQQTLLKYKNLQVSKQQLLEGSKNHTDNLKGILALQNVYFIRVKQRTKRLVYTKSSKSKQMEQYIQKNRQQMGLNDYELINPQRQTQANNFHQQYKQKLLSNIIFTTKYIPLQSSFSSSNNEIKLQKCIEILYLTIKSQQTFQLERILLKVIEFLFKYQTSQSIVFKFYYDRTKEEQKQKINQLKSILEIHNCIVAEKNVAYDRQKLKGINKPSNGYSTLNKQQIKQNSNLTQAKFHFTRKDQLKISRNLNTLEQNQYLSLNPFTLQINLYGLFASQKLNFNSQCSKEQKYLSQLNYDYLLTEIVKNHLNSDHFMTIKNKCNWQHRLRIIIQNILSLEQHQPQQKHLPFLQIIQSPNLTELNKILQAKNKSIWIGINDLFKNNLLKMFSLGMNVTLPYHRKAFIHSKSGIPYFRFQIQQKVDVLHLKINEKSYLKSQSSKQRQVLNNLQEQLERRGKIKIYLLPCKQKKNIRIGFFDATNITNFMRLYNLKIKQQQKSNKKAVEINISDLLNIFFSIKTQNPTKSLQQFSKQSEFIRNLYIPMIKQNSKNKFSINQFHKNADHNPSSSNSDNNIASQQKIQNKSNHFDYSKSQLIYPIKCQELQCLSAKKNDPNNQFYVGTNIQWFYDTHLQNGIRYIEQPNKNDLWFKGPGIQKTFQNDKKSHKNEQEQTNMNNQNMNLARIGIVLFLIPQNIVIYTKIL